MLISTEEGGQDEQWRLNSDPCSNEQRLDNVLRNALVSSQFTGTWKKAVNTANAKKNSGIIFVTKNWKKRKKG